MERRTRPPFTPFSLDTREPITDKCILRQLTYFAHANRLGSPLWLSWSLAARLGLTLRYMQSPLNIWYPLVGENFIPLIRPSPFSDAVMHRYPLSQVFSVSPPASSGMSEAKRILVLSAAASSDGCPRWYTVPDSMRHLFVMPPKFLHTRSSALQLGGLLQFFGLWVSETILGSVAIAPETQVKVRTPRSLMCVVNADQLYPSTLLAEKELECMLMQRSVESSSLGGIR